MNPAMMGYWLSQLQQPTPGIGLGRQMEPLQMPNEPQMGMNIPDMGMPEPMAEERPSPITRGASAGMEAARQSMALSGEQRSRAFGHGLMAFSGNMNRPKHGEGFAGTLGAINEALNPALQAYVNRQDKEREMNAGLLAREDALEKERIHEARLQQEMADLKAYRNASLEVDRLKAGKGVVGISPRRETLMAQGVLPENAGQLFEEMPKEELKVRQKNLLERKNRYIPASENVHKFEVAAEIYKAHPNLWRHPAAIIEATRKKNPGYLNQFAGSLSPKEISAATKISKVMGDVALNEIKNFPGVKTDLVKRQIMDTLATGMTDPESFELIKNENVKKNKRIVKDAKMAQDAWNHRYDVPEYLDEEAGVESPVGGGEKAEVGEIMNMSPEELQAEYLKELNK